MARLCRQNYFVYDQPGFTRVFFQVILEHFTNGLIDSTHNI
jgi:hypothetical protein